MTQQRLLFDAIIPTFVTSAAPPAGDSLPLSYVVNQHTAEVSFTGDITALTVFLEGKYPGSNFHTMFAQYEFNAADIAAKQATFDVTNVSFDGIRMGIASITNGGDGILSGIYKADGVY